MTATVITGIFNASSISWTNTNGGAAFDGFVSLGNNGQVAQTFQSASITGLNPSEFSFDSTQLPVTVQPGKSVLLHVSFIPGGAGTRSAYLNLVLSPGPNIQVFLSGTQNGPGGGQPFPSSLGFVTPVKLGLSSTFANVQIVNTTGGADAETITVSSIAFATGTDFFIVGAPVTPFTIPYLGVSAAFSIQFTPTVAGSRSDTLNIVTTTPAFTLNAFVSGTGTTLQSAYTVSGAVSQCLFAFPGTSTPVIRAANPASLNCEEAGSLVRLHDFNQPNVEKQLLRVRGHYEDLGVATITITAKTRRVGEPDSIVQKSVSIGTVAADSWLREFIADLNIAGELIQLTISRAANSGPVNIVDYVPSFEPKGEVIEGT